MEGPKKEHLAAQTKLGAPEKALSPEDAPLLERFDKFLEGLDIPEHKQREAAAFKKVLDVLEKRSLTDVLTGLPNRRAFMEELARWEDLSVRRGDDFCLVAFDLDGFKYVNDSFGHSMGDESLKRVAEEVLKKLRPSDFFARTGGDEFIILLPESDQDQGIIAAEKVRRAIENEVSVAMQELAAERDASKAERIRLSASIGVDSKMRDASMSADTLLKHADFASYVVKAAGKKGTLSYLEARQLDAESKGELYRAFLKEQGET